MQLANRTSVSSYKFHRGRQQFATIRMTEQYRPRLGSGESTSSSSESRIIPSDHSDSEALTYHFPDVSHGIPMNVWCICTSRIAWENIWPLIHDYTRSTISIQDFCQNPKPSLCVPDFLKKKQKEKEEKESADTSSYYWIQVPGNVMYWCDVCRTHARCVFKSWFCG